MFRYAESMHIVMPAKQKQNAALYFLSVQSIAIKSGAVMQT